LYESVLGSFYSLTVWVCKFLAKGNPKGKHKMLVKLAIQVNFTNTLHSVFLYESVFEAFMHSEENRRLNKGRQKDLDKRRRG